MKWSIGSTPAPAEASSVVSEMGDAWSPKRPPDNTAATLSAREASTVTAAGKAKGNNSAKVPQEDPVAKETRQATIKIKSGNCAPLIEPATQFAT